ncbi:MAG TPA: hypothetical protein VGD59_02375 [Acidisarcina sp.]
MSIAVAAGIPLELFLAPTPLEPMRAWPEFQRSGWTDLYAFGIANTLDSAISHLLIGPIVGAIFGTFGGLLTLASRATGKIAEPPRA